MHFRIFQSYTTFIEESSCDCHFRPSMDRTKLIPTFYVHWASIGHKIEVNVQSCINRFSEKQSYNFTNTSMEVLHILSQRKSFWIMPNQLWLFILNIAGTYSKTSEIIKISSQRLGLRIYKNWSFFFASYGLLTLLEQIIIDMVLCYVPAISKFLSERWVYLSRMVPY